jgi:hypothetical protein
MEIEAGDTRSDFNCIDLWISGELVYERNRSCWIAMGR